jgi:putative redox protein
MADFDKAAKWTSAIIEKDHYKTQIFTDTHHLVADEPLDVGGTNLGPSPGDFLRMSLASCTAITLRMYADRKNLAVEKIEVKVHTEASGGKTIFHSKILLTGSVTDEQKLRMLQIAKLCPVHKMLVNPIETTSTIGYADSVGL